MPTKQTLDRSEEPYLVVYIRAKSNEPADDSLLETTANTLAEAMMNTLRDMGWKSVAGWIDLFVPQEAVDG